MSDTLIWPHCVGTIINKWGVRSALRPFNIISNAVTWRMHNTGGVADVRISVDKAGQRASAVLCIQLAMTLFVFH